MRYNTYNYHAVGADSAYRFGLHYFGIDVRENSLCNFKIHNRSFVLEIGSITGSLFQSNTYLYIAGIYSKNWLDTSK